MEYDVEKINKWKPPKENGVTLLTMPNIPNGLHSLNPRNIMGQTKWNVIRKRCYMEANYTCQICGKYCGHGMCDAHEVYRYDFIKCRANFERLICVCKKCHNTIHSGRLISLFKKQQEGALSKMDMLNLAQRLFKMIETWNKEHPDKPPLRVSATFIDWAKTYGLSTSMKAFIENYNVKFAAPKEYKKWHIWKLYIGDKEYTSPFKTYQEWEAKFGK